MTKAKDLGRLAELAQLVLDNRLGQLRGARDRLDQSRMQLAALAEDGRDADLDPVLAARVGLGYERWADVRRAELNLVIARQTATWLEAREEAQTAVGRLQALEKLAEKTGVRR